MLKNFALITGAGKGLGLEFANEYGRRGKDLLLVSLPGEGLTELCERFSKVYNVEAYFLETDLLRPDSVYEVTQWAENYKVDTLVNNAGLGGAGFFDQTSPGFIDDMILLNVRAVAMLTRLILPLLMKNTSAYIINVSSLAAFSPMAYKMVYPASKVFVYSLSRSLHEEFKGKNISVTVVTPGPMYTNPDVVHRINKIGFWGRLGVIPPEKVARNAIKKNLKKRAVYIPGFFNKLNWMLMRIVPLWFVLFIVSKVFKKEFK